MIKRVRSTLAALIRRDRFEDALSDEVRYHIDAYTEDLVRSGVSPQDAARRARIEFGGLERIKDDCREARGLRLFDEVQQDIRYGIRVLRKNPGFATVAVLTLGLGIGVTTAIFSAVDAVIIRPLPYVELDHLVLPQEHLPSIGSGTVSPVGAAEFADYRDRCQSFSRIAAFETWPRTLTGAGEPERLRG